MNYEQTDVVFVIEKSITLKRYLTELLDTYISPAISFFSGGISEENDVFFTQSSLVQYALVFYGSELTVLGSSTQVETHGPTTSQLSILNAIKDANYCYRNTCRQAYILEALQTASEVFKSLSGGNAQKDSVRRCLVLVTQSAPISNPWATASPENILQDLKMIGVKMSIISAHKLVELYRLFENAGGDQQSITMKNYANKPQHLVLLNGFTLQERAVSPSLISQPTPPTQMVMPVVSSGPSPNPITHRPIPSPGQPHTVTGSPAPPQQQPNQVPIARTPAVMNPAPSSQPIPAQSPGSLIRPQVVPISNSTTNVNMGTRPRWPLGPNNLVYPGTGTMMVQNQQTVPQTMSQVPMSSQGPNPQIPSGNISNIQQMNQQRTASPTIIWQGTLEWSEKKHMPGGGNAIQRIPCKISSQPMNGKLDIKTDGWPSTLQMLLVQKNLLSSVGNTYFQNIHKVIFFPDPCPALESLTASLSQGYAGCVHLSSSSIDVKMIILLFSAEKRAYIGFIPLEQAAFVAKIKQVFQSQSRNMQSQAINKQNVGGNMIPGVNNQQTIVPTQNMQMIPNPSGMNVSQGNMIMQQNQLNPTMTQGGMASGNPMVSGQVSQVGTNQVNQIGGGGQGQSMGMVQQPQMGMVNHVSQGGPIGPNQSVLANKLIRPMNITGQQQPTDQMQMRQNLIQLQQRPSLQVSLGQPRMMQSQMRQLLQQQRLQQQQQQQHQQQQQQQQQQQLLMIQQQNMRPQMNQGQQVMGPQVMGQQVMGQQGMGQQGMGQQGIGQQSMGQGMGQQGVGQQGMSQQGMGQQGMGQQVMGQQGMGQPMQESTTDYMDLL